MRTNPLFHLLLSSAVLCACGWLHANDPYVPTDDSVVLEVLPTRLFGTNDELVRLRAALTREPNNPQSAAALAAVYGEWSGATGDPRYIGYAQAALKPWWDQPNPPTEVLMVRAKLREKNHQYDAAVADLERVVKREPDNSQAWLELANICRVQGNYERAEAACDHLDQTAGSLSATIARAPLLAVTGQAGQASLALAPIPDSLRERSANLYSWLLAMRGELARIQGDRKMAEYHLKSAVRHDPADTYAIRAYADLLLDDDRAEAVADLTEEHRADNGVLLRAAIAATRLGRASAAGEPARILAERFKEIRLRGDKPHGRFAARFALEVEKKPQQALEIAMANWQEQKEYRDARIALDAALAAGDATPAEPVVRFLQKHGTEDADLASRVNAWRQLRADQ
jgi:tetratricopeptide (TPR) repeat protein